ncbi:MAG: hypothetical protein ACLTMP_02405 [Eggerthella lenta]
MAITGRAAGGAEVDAGKAAADAVGEVLAYYRVKPADARATRRACATSWTPSCGEQA